MSDEWQMRASGGLAAHFIVPEGASLPGVQWTVEMQRGGETQVVSVRTIFGEGIDPELRASSERQAQIAMQYLADRLASGWSPGQEPPHVIYIGGPPPSMPVKAKKPWWKFW